MNSQSFGSREFEACRCWGFGHGTPRHESGGTRPSGLRCWYWSSSNWCRWSRPSGRKRLACRRIRILWRISRRHSQRLSGISPRPSGWLAHDHVRCEGWQTARRAPHGCSPCASARRSRCNPDVARKRGEHQSPKSLRHAGPPCLGSAIHG